MQDKLIVAINASNKFYTLYADGIYTYKHINLSTGITQIEYAAGSVIFLYYTYQTYRTVYAARYVIEADAEVKLTALPGLSKKVEVLFQAERSRLDKTKRAVAFLNTHYRSAYKYSDVFYKRLGCVIAEAGKIDYLKIKALADSEEKAGRDFDFRFRRPQRGQKLKAIPLEKWSL